MSTSSDCSWVATNPGICSFEYPAVKPAMPGKFDPKRVEVEDSPHEGGQKQLSQARQEGQREGELRARKIFEESLRNERTRIEQALTEFTEERKSYFRRVENEVVQLALAIARKVLHREAQVDPALLAGIVRVSIEQLAESTGVVLRVHPSEEAEWLRFFTESGLAPAPKIVGDAVVPAERCVISTQLGTTEIGIESQLKEIEQGLFDLIAQRPGA